MSLSGEREAQESGLLEQGLQALALTLDTLLLLRFTLPPVPCRRGRTFPFELCTIVRRGSNEEKEIVDCNLGSDSDDIGGKRCNG